jgi:hypothetical protein
LEFRPPLRRQTAPFSGGFLGVSGIVQIREHEAHGASFDGIPTPVQELHQADATDGLVAIDEAKEVVRPPVEVFGHSPYDGLRVQ